MADFFKYEVDKRLAPFWLPFGLHPSTDGVTITDDGKFVAKYGFLKLETSVSNIDDAYITRTTGGGRPPGPGYPSPTMG